MAVRLDAASYDFASTQAITDMKSIASIPINWDPISKQILVFGVLRNHTWNKIRIRSKCWLPILLFHFRMPFHTNAALLYMLLETRIPSGISPINLEKCVIVTWSCVDVYVHAHSSYPRASTTSHHQMGPLLLAWCLYQGMDNSVHYFLFDLISHPYLNLNVG